MANINIHRLFYDLHVNNRLVALDTQNRISALSGPIASCLHSAMEKYDRPDLYLTLDRIELNLKTIHYENLEDELLQRIKKIVDAEIASIFHDIQINKSDGTSEIKPYIDKLNHVTGIKCEKIVDHEKRTVKYFLETSLPVNKTTNTVLTKAMIIRSFNEYSDLMTWFINVQKQNINVLERLLYHLSDNEIRSIIPEQNVPEPELFRKLTESLLFTGVLSQEQLRIFIWRFIFIQKAAEKIGFDYFNFIKAFSDKFSISLNDCISKLPDQILKKIGMDVTARNWVNKIEIETQGIDAYLVEPVSKINQNKTIHHLDKNQFSENNGKFSTKEAQLDQKITRLNDNIETPKIKPVSKMDENDTRLINPSIDKRSNEQETKHKNASIELLPHNEFETNEKFYIHNAGIVLAAPFLNRFFQTLKYIENGQFINQEKQKRAVVLLEYFYPPHEISETSMILNKALCGLEIRTPVPVWMKPEAFERKEIDELIQSLIHYWTTLKNTSVDAFKYNFFNRNAIMTINEHQLRLHIQRESIDVLIETLPWSISIIKHDWMKKIIMVDW